MRPLVVALALVAAACGGGGSSEPTCDDVMNAVDDAIDRTGTVVLLEALEDAGLSERDAARCLDEG